MQKYCYNCMYPLEGASFCGHCGADCKAAPACATYHLPCGTALGGDYIVGRVLGEGGFGITYIGLQKTLSKRVAIKEFYPSGIAQRDNSVSNNVEVPKERRDFFQKGVDRFLFEAKSVAAFNDEEGIVDVQQYFHENNTAYIVMEFLDGENLKQYISRHGLFDADELISLLIPVMKALKNMHAKGLIHRDISPDNIMYTKRGKLKLMDFGSARSYLDDEEQIAIILKQGFAPEEQFRHDGEQGPYTDVYALCATIYACITGKAPSDSLDRSVTDDLKKPSELGISIPENLEKALMKGLAVHRENRFRNMSELIAAIEKKPVPTEKKKTEAKENLTIVTDDKESDESKTIAADDAENNKNKTIDANDLKKDEQKTVSADAPVMAKKPVDWKQAKETDKTNEKNKRGKKVPLIISSIALVLVLAIVGVFVVKPIFDKQSESSSSGSTTSRSAEGSAPSSWRSIPA